MKTPSVVEAGPIPRLEWMLANPEKVELGHLEAAWQHLEELEQELPSPFEVGVSRRSVEALAYFQQACDWIREAFFRVEEALYTPGPDAWDRVREAYREGRDCLFAGRRIKGELAREYALSATG